MLKSTPIPSNPPGPDASAAAQLAWFESDPFGCVEEAARSYGPMFTLRLGSLGNEDLVGIEHRGEWVFLSTPDQLKTMYYAGDSASSGAQANQVFFGTAEESVGYIDGKAHRRRRSQLHPAFSGNRDYIAIIESAVDSHLARWPREQPFSLFTGLQLLTSEIIVEIVCGNFCAADRTELTELLPLIENAAFSREQVLAADQRIRDFIDVRLPGHLAASEALGTDDVMAALLRHAADGDADLTDEVVRDEVFSLLFTGFATTANTLAWALLRVLENPGVADTLAAELGDRFRTGPHGRDDFGGLDYVDKTLMETLRLHPVSALNGVRMVTAPTWVDPYMVPAGTILVHCAYLLHRNPEYYPEPLAFRPERFDGDPVDQYLWGPFGGGTRTCVGRGYALAQMRVILALILSRARLRATGPLPPARQQGIFMGPADGARCVVEGQPAA
jgi:cytochrome P450